MDKYDIYNAHKAWVIAQTEIKTEDFAQRMIFSLDIVQGFYGIKDNTMFIAFQGSADYRDVLSDLDAFMVSLDGAKVHFGFYKQYKRIESYIDNLVNPNIDKPVSTDQTNLNSSFESDKKSAQRVIFSGQSLGGAIAIIASYIIKKKYPKLEISTVTFGTPKVGNQEFVNAFKRKNIEIKQYIYKDDIIPRLPFKIVGYRETSEPIYFGEYKWYEKILHIITQFTGNPFNHGWKNYKDEFVL